MFGREFCEAKGSVRLRVTTLSVNLAKKREDDTPAAGDLRNGFLKSQRLPGYNFQRCEVSERIFFGNRENSLNYPTGSPLGWLSLFKKFTLSELFNRLLVGAFFASIDPLASEFGQFSRAAGAHFLLNLFAMSLHGLDA